MKKVFEFISKYASKGKGIRTVTQWGVLITFAMVAYLIYEGKIDMVQLDELIAWSKAFENYFYALVFGTVIGGGYGKYIDYKKENGQSKP